MFTLWDTFRMFLRDLPHGMVTSIIYLCPGRECSENSMAQFRPYHGRFIWILSSWIMDISDILPRQKVSNPRFDQNSQSVSTTPKMSIDPGLQRFPIDHIHCFSPPRPFLPLLSSEAAHRELQSLSSSEIAKGF